MILIKHCSIMKMGMSEEKGNKRNTLRSQRLRPLKFKNDIHPYYILYCFNHTTCWKLQNFGVTKNDQWLSDFLGLAEWNVEQRGRLGHCIYFSTWSLMVLKS